MGLRPADGGSPALRGWAWPGALALAAAAVAASGLALPLRYERDAIAAGETWRLLTGHLAHLGTAHLVMNLAALALVWLLVGHAFKAWAWGVAMVTIALGIDAGFWWLLPELEWYVGLSGILHGVLAAGAPGVILQVGRVGEGLLLLAALAAKLAFEQVGGAVPGSAALAGGPVVVDAHLYGALAGLAVGSVLAVAVDAGGGRSCKPI
ncbi:MAG TPA: rhombosortase [Woeseiaceae bacterium]|nr:rhombosortase [Woeseiaceae bacterium]